MPTRNGTDLYRDAVAHLTACHPTFARVIAQVGPCTLKPKRDLFAALVNTVISQQISVRAADTIAARLEAAAGGKLVPERVLALSPLGRMAAPQRNRDLQCLQLCINRDALAHPAGAPSRRVFGILAALA